MIRVRKRNSHKERFVDERDNAMTNWELSQVNEMLTQMENFDVIFIATTNLMDNLDRASLRRFDLKLEFKYLKPEQAWKLFKIECENIGINISDNLKNIVKSISNLTPGDFAAVIRQHRFSPIENAKDFIKRLQNEIDIKKIESSKKIRFMEI